MSTYLSIAFGGLLFLAGIILLFVWFNVFLKALMVFIPAVLILIGSVVLTAGFGDLKNKQNKPDENSLGEGQV